MKETEVTVEVLEDIESVKNKLINSGFKIVERVNMMDYYFSKYSRRELDRLDYSELIKNSFLIRDVKSDNYVTKNIVYKDKVVDEKGNVVSEQKVKCAIDDVDRAIEIFKLSDLNCWCELKQNMLVFNNGKIEFVFQEVENVGVFIEIEEDDTIKCLDEYEKIEILLNRLKELNIKIGNDYSCKKVYMKYKLSK